MRGRSVLDRLDLSTQGPSSLKAHHMAAVTQHNSDGSAYQPSHSSSNGDDGADALGDLYVWGEGMGEGVLGGGNIRRCAAGDGKAKAFDSLVPKALESGTMLDVWDVACGEAHASLVTRQGEVFCWGEEGGGRLGMGVDRDEEHPRLIESLSHHRMDQVGAHPAFSPPYSCTVSFPPSFCATSLHHPSSASPPSIRCCVARHS